MLRVSHLSVGSEESLRSFKLDDNTVRFSYYVEGRFEQREKVESEPLINRQLQKPRWEMLDAKRDKEEMLKKTEQALVTMWRTPKREKSGEILSFCFRQLDRGCCCLPRESGQGGRGRWGGLGKPLCRGRDWASSFQRPVWPSQRRFPVVVAYKGLKRRRKIRRREWICGSSNFK